MAFRYPCQSPKQEVFHPHILEMYFFLPFPSPLTYSVQNKEILVARIQASGLKYLHKQISPNSWCVIWSLWLHREKHNPSPFSLTIKCPHGIYTPASSYQFSLVIGVTKKPLKGLFGHARFSLIYQLINNSSLQSFKLKKKSWKLKGEKSKIKGFSHFFMYAINHRLWLRSAT